MADPVLALTAWEVGAAIIGVVVVVPTVQEVTKIGARRVFGDHHRRGGDTLNGRVKKDACFMCKDGIDTRMKGYEDWTGKIEATLRDYIGQRAKKDELIARELGGINEQLKKIVNGKE